MGTKSHDVDEQLNRVFVARQIELALEALKSENTEKCVEFLNEAYDKIQNSDSKGKSIGLSLVVVVYGLAALTLKNLHVWWRIKFCRSARLSPLLTLVQFPLGTTYDSYVKRVSQRSAESRGFSPGTPVSSHREC